MKNIALFTFGILLTACATTNTTTSSTSSNKTKKEVVVTGGESENDLPPATKHPNSAEPDNSTPAPYKQGDLRTY